jgi:acyl-CoA reductase-like NAD-dependent aldehyde dehydrogenase
METIAHADLAQTDAAIELAAKAQKKWAALNPSDRAMLLHRFAATVDANIEALAQLEVRNSGHPISQASWEATHVRNVLEYYSASPERLIGKQIPVAGGIAVTFNEPLGVVGVITPWNFPMTIASWGFAPALAAGNAVVLKPARTTPLTAFAIAKYLKEAGLPDGVLQVITGSGSVLGDALVSDPRVRKVSFTGSTVTGTHIASIAGAKKLSLELGSSCPVIVMDDADIEYAADAVALGGYINAGQVCISVQRVIVHEKVMANFLDALKPRVEAIKVGDPKSADTKVGTLISEKDTTHLFYKFFSLLAN